MNIWLNKITISLIESAVIEATYHLRRQHSQYRDKMFSFSLVAVPLNNGATTFNAIQFQIDLMTAEISRKEFDDCIDTTERALMFGRYLAECYIEADRNGTDLELSL